MINNPFIDPTHSIAQAKQINQNTIIIKSAHFKPQELNKYFQNYEKVHTGSINGLPYVAILFQNKQSASQAIEFCLKNLEFMACFIQDYVNEEYVISALNIPQTSEEKLKEAFQIFGKVEYVRLYKDNEKEQLGIAQIRFEDKISKNKALEAKNLPFEEQIIQILNDIPKWELENKQNILHKIKSKKNRRRIQAQNIGFSNKQFQDLESNVEVGLKNEMRTPARLIRKKIHKIQDQHGTDGYVVVQKLRRFNQIVQRKQEEFFKMPPQLRARREQRKQKMIDNRKKANLLHKKK